MVEAKLVSSSLSLPSSARPRFSLLSDSKGVIARDFSKFALPSIVSLQKKIESYRWLDNLQLIIEESFAMADIHAYHSQRKWHSPKLFTQHILGVFVGWVENDVCGLVNYESNGYTISSFKYTAIFIISPMECLTIYIYICVIDIYIKLKSIILK